MSRTSASGGAASKGGQVSAMAWADARRNDPAHRPDIDALLVAMNLEQDLIALREKRDLTQTQLAELVGVKQPQIAKLESGKTRNLELRTLVKIAAALGGRVKITFEPDPRLKTKVKNGRKRSAA